MHAHQAAYDMRPHFSVLLVERESLVSDYVEDILEGTRFDVVGVATAPGAAVEMAGRTHPRLAIVELTLQSGLDGLEAARVLCERFGTAIVLVTGPSGAGAHANGLEGASARLIRKPFLPRQLLSVLDAAAADIRH